MLASATNIDAIVIGGNIIGYVLATRSYIATDLYLPISTTPIVSYHTIVVPREHRLPKASPKLSFAVICRFV